MAPRILIVDDEAIIAETTELTLRQLGYGIAGRAASGVEACEAVVRETPDLVLMDINLGDDREGIQAAEVIRLKQGVPVVYVTAYTDEETLARAKVTHPFGYVAKPFEARDLRVAIEIALHNHRLEQRLRQSERALRESESRQRAILDNIPDIAWLKDRAGRYLAVNRAWCTHFGRRETDVLGRTTLEVMSGPLAQKFHEEDLEVMARGEVYQGEDRLQNEEGSLAFYEVFKAPVRDSAGEVIGLAGTTRDVSERVRLADAYAERAEHFAALLATTRDGVLETDEQGRILDANQAYCALTGYERGELVGQHVSKLEALESAAQVDAHTREMIARGGGRFESRHRAKDGHLIDFEISISHLSPRRRMVAFLHDITVRKRREAERRAAEIFFHAVWEQSASGMRLTDTTGTIRAVNEAFCRLVGMPREALVGQPFTCIYEETDDFEEARMLHRYRERFSERAVTERYARRMTLRDGRVLELDVTNSFVELDQAVLLLTLLRDETAQRQAEAARRESEQRFRGYFDSGLIGMCITSVSAGWVQCNDRLCEMLGYTREELAGKTWTELTHPEDLAADLTQFNRVLAGEIDSYIIEKRFWHKSGRTIDAELFARAVRREDGSIDHFIAMVQDISQRKRAEWAREEMAQSLRFKNRELERLVYLTSHDLRTPMLNIQGFAHRIAGDCETLRRIIAAETIAPADRAEASDIVGRRLPRSFGFIQSGVEKMDRLIASLLRLSRLGRAGFQPKTLDLNAVVNETLRAQAFSLQAVEGVVETRPLPSCTGDAAMVSQLFANLIDNAIKYRSPSRRLVLEISGEVRGGEAVYCVADNGVGIRPEDRERIWEVFFRADPAETAGDGLGLNLVRGIAERHGGRVWVESVRGEGSRFYVALPTASTPPPAAV